MILKNRCVRIIFLIFLVSICMTYLLYLNSSIEFDQESHPTSYLLKSDRPASREDRLFDEQRIDAFLNFWETISIHPFLLEPYLLYRRLDKLEQAYFISKNLNPHVFQTWNINFNTFGLKVSGRLAKKVSAQCAVYILSLVWRSFRQSPSYSITMLSNFHKRRKASFSTSFVSRTD